MLHSFLMALCFLSPAHSALIVNNPDIKAPVTREISYQLKKFDDVRDDEFYWLKNRDSADVVKHLRAENQYFEKIFKPAKSLKKQLFNEMRSRIKEDDSTYPAKNGSYLYSKKYEAGKQYPLYIRTKADNSSSKPEVLFDINKLARGHSFYHAEYFISPDQKLAALVFDKKGRRFYNIRIKNLATGKFLTDEIKNTTDNVVWATDNETLFYVKQDPDTLRFSKVYRYNLKSKKSELVYEEAEETFEVFLSTSLSKKHLFISSSSTLSAEVRSLEADKPNATPVLLWPREPKHEFSINEDEDSYYFLTNKNAKNFKLVKTGFADFNQQHAVEVIPHREDTFIDNFIVFKNYIVLASRTNGLTQFEIYDKATKKLSKITYEDSAYSVEFAANDEYDSPGFRYTYQSLRTPPSVYDYLFAEQKSLLRKTKQVPNFNADLYKTERIFVTVRDGQKVPVSLLMKKEHQKNAQSPALLYGYGSYGSNSDPWFSVSDLSLVDRGFVYAIIHVRGGGEMGRSWTDNGRVLNKKNTFTDFIDVTEYLIKEKYVDPKNIFATGASAGGLLMGAISNMRPDLYKGIIAEVPFVDVLTTMLDSSIPLTTAEYDEWGNPNVKEYYDYIKTYSPYDNVTKKNYPNLLITTGVHDSQVQYWEPAKWAARLRKLNQSNSLILLHTDMDSGHGGKSGRFEQLDETAEQYAFILGLL